ncbi:hypothetical protein [Actinophytocola sp. KF-1]
MEDYEPLDSVNGSRWVEDRRELASLIAQALSDPEIADALRTLGVPAPEAAREISDRNGLFARFRTAQRWPIRLRLFEEVADARFPRLRPGVGALYGLALVGAYLAVLLMAYPRMPVHHQVFGLVGLGATVAVAVRLARKDVVVARRAVQAIREPHRAPNLLRDIVLAEVRQYLAEHGLVRYGTELPVDQTGLIGGAVEPTTIVTPAGQQLQRLAQSSASDAVALAGPRGVGKTTTIRAIADGMFSDADEPPPLAVVTAAPSRYEPRDFVLHLHAALCRRVIALLNGYLRLPPEDNKRWRIRWQWFKPWLIVAGLIIFLLIMARGLWDPSYPDFSSMFWDRPDSPPKSGAAWPDPVPLAFFDTLRFTVAFALFGVFVQVVAIFAFVVVREIHRFLDEPGDWRLTTLRTEAYDELHRIRFLQTFTSGWSGKIGLPYGADLGLNRSTQLAEQTLTHPEVVDNFRRFAQRCATTLVRTGVAGRLVIAIDELDKITDPEQVHEFVNEVKGIFGVPGCLFLVSVSEDAIVAFERRGIPVRDAFDSAFTHMIRLENFTLSESKRWLSRRLLAVPDQFTYLLHCLSGGLPRELQRATNELVDIVRDDKCADLAHVTTTMLDRELARKAHAFAAAAQRFEDAPELSSYLSDLMTMTEPSVDQLALAHRLAPAGATNELQRIRWQSACFLLFCVTVREVFVNTLSKDGLRNLDSLARARAHLAVDPQTAWQLVQSVRSAADLGEND